MTDSRLDVSIALVEDLVVANRVLANHGVLDAFGHVSARSDRHPDRYVLAHFLPPELVNKDDLIEYDCNSNPIAPAPPKQYLERYIHGEIYLARPDVMAVVHSHSPSVIPFAASSIPLIPIYHMGGFLGVGAPIFDIAERFGDTDMLVRTSEQGRYLAATLGSSAIALMRGHGFAAVGQSIPEAVYRAIYTELNARLQREAITLGGSVKYLTTGEAEQADTTNMWGIEKPWKLWKQKVLKQGLD